MASNRVSYADSSGTHYAMFFSEINLLFSQLIHTGENAFFLRNLLVLSVCANRFVLKLSLVDEGFPVVAHSATTDEEGVRKAAEFAGARARLSSPSRLDVIC